jgi:hypothetical protein
MIEKSITLTTELTDAEALALAQFMKRVGFSEWRQNAIDDDEAYLMRDGCDKIASALVDVGYNPR